MLIKIIIGKLGLTVFFQKIKLFDHGKNDVERNFEVFIEHFSEVKKFLPKDFVVLELGPGYSINSAVFASCLGASFSYLVDQGSFIIKKDTESVRKFLESKNIACSENDFKNYKYLTGGLESLKEIPDNSIDFVFSNAVLEHVKKNDFLPILVEIRRIIKYNGVCSHIVDLRDHLDESLNNLRFSENFWESNLVHNSGFYTNRIRFSEMVVIFEKVGFSCEVVKNSNFRKPLLPKHKIDKKFREYDSGDLGIATFHAVLTPKT